VKKDFRFSIFDFRLPFCRSVNRASQIKNPKLWALGAGALVCGLLAAIWLATSTRPERLIGPYLQAVTEESVYVLVECAAAGTARVEYGPTASYGSSAQAEAVAPTASSTFVHKIKLSGLRPDTVYHYRAWRNETPCADATFRTLVPPGTGFRFAVLGDLRTGTNVHDTISRRLLGVDRPLLSLYLGDLCYDGSCRSYKKEFFRADELALDAGVAFFSATGNHEGWGINTKAFTQAPSSLSGRQGYYSFDCGDLHVLVLNCCLEYTSRSPQYRFAQTDLAGANRAWKVVLFHCPAYCGGGHGEDLSFQAMTSDVFEPNGVTLVLSGHSHFYQHNLVNGIHHLVVGSSGAQLYEPESAPYTLKTVKDYSYGIGDVTPTNLHFVVYNDRGAVLDTLDLERRRMKDER